MANQEHLAILKQGVDEWNNWRNEHPELNPDLRGAIIRGTDLSRANFSDASLTRASLSRATLFQADLRGTYLNEATLNEANLREANLSRANLFRANLFRADFNAANLRGANLRGTDLSEATLSGVVLSGADLSVANLRGVNLRESDLTLANLSGANLSGAKINGVDLSGAIVGLTVFGNVDLRTVKGLETLQHLSPSTIGIDTILYSEGLIPEVFLRGTGATESFIAYIRSLSQNPIKYPTCFISYSSKDQDFAERLYADLQNKGIRCWYAPEDLKIGDEFRNRIDESIRLNDKLIVILSENSIDSSWVEFEVNRALRKEQEQGKPVLFPLKLDEIVMETPEAWAADIRKKRHIGDFTHWKNHEDFQKSFSRLLRDLKTEF